MHTGDRQRAGSRFKCQGGGRLALAGDPALSNSRARVDPLVGGIYQARKLLICDDPLGQVLTPTDNVCVFHNSLYWEEIRDWLRSSLAAGAGHLHLSLMSSLWYNSDRSRPGYKSL